MSGEALIALEALVLSGGLVGATVLYARRAGRLDVPNDRMFVTDFAGSVYSARLDGSGERNFLYAQGNLTGIAYAEI